MATPEDELNNYLDELTATISKTNQVLDIKGKEIIKAYTSILDPNYVPHDESSISPPLTNVPLASSDPTSSVTPKVPPKVPNPQLKSKLNRTKEFFGFKETDTQKINKEINMVLKNDVNIDINMGTYPELQLNEVICNKIKEKSDSEKLNSYIYYFFYILMKYIIKLIIDDKSKKITNLKGILLKNNEVLKNYINYEFNVTSQNYTRIKQQFTEIHTFITDFLKNGPETVALEETRKTLDESFNTLLGKLQHFQFT